MSHRARSGQFTLEVTDRRVSCGDAPIALPPKMHDVLVVLAQRAGRLVTRRELLDAVWADAFVEEGAHDHGSRPWLMADGIWFMDPSSITISHQPLAISHGTCHCGWSVVRPAAPAFDALPE